MASLLNRSDVDTIYVCTDSGREGEYIYRLVAQEAGVQDKVQKRVWIDSQTREEILRGIKEARDESDYDHLAASAYLRAKEDYLMGINFSRLLTLKYGNTIAGFLKKDRVQFDFCGTGDELRAGNGGSKREGDPRLCEDPLLSGPGRCKSFAGIPGTEPRQSWVRSDGTGI